MLPYPELSDTAKVDRNKQSLGRGWLTVAQCDESSCGLVVCNGFSRSKSGVRRGLLA
jgi:hypothetical protein